MHDVTDFLDGMNVRADAHVAAGRLGGTPALAGPEATLRGLASIRQGKAVSLSRPIDVRGDRITPGSAEFEVDIRVAGRVGIAKDRLHVRCHSMDDTHIDGPNHLGLDGRWYPGVDDFEDAPSIAGWAESGIHTRALFVDIPTHRGESWVDVDNPVRVDEIEHVLREAGTEPRPGDALMLCMGRDAWEASTGSTSRADHYSGVDASVAAFIEEQQFAALCWDFVDSPAGKPDHMSVHFLNYAVGLATIDNCRFSPLREALGGERIEVFLSVAPLMIVRGTGSVVNPMVLL